MVKPKPKRTWKRALLFVIVTALVFLTGHAIASVSNSGRTESAQVLETHKVSAQAKTPVKTAENASDQKPTEPTPEPTPVPTPAPTPPPVDPNGCEAKGMWYRADNNECIPKTQPKAAAPAPAATVTPTPVASTSGVEQWRSLVASYFGSETDYALRIMQCESGGNTAAHSPTNDYGLMQVNAVHAAKVGGDLSALYNPETNIRIAKQIRDGSGWKAWSCSSRV